MQFIQGVRVTTTHTYVPALHHLFAALLFWRPLSRVFAEHPRISGRATDFLEVVPVA